MNILFYRYGSIYEPDMIDAFRLAGINIIEINGKTSETSNDEVNTVHILEEHINTFEPLFIYSINYFPIISEICHIYNILYVSQTVDSPVLTLFSKTIRYNTNRIFLFDKAQYDFFSPFNKNCIYHLPLASATMRFDKVVKSITATDRKRFSSDISFVGSLYREKDPLANIEDLPDYTKGYINALIACCLRLYGYYPARDSLTDDIISSIKKASGPVFPTATDIIAPSDSYVTSHEYIASHLAVIERERTLNALASHFNVSLYTMSDSSYLNGVNVHSVVDSLNVMPKVFYLSKINLNITMRSIETGLPLRFFDILGCGGFLMSNYQPEIEDMFMIGRDLETYSSIEELIDKCSYYLKHDDIRIKIAKAGHEKVCSEHTHCHRMKEMFEKIIR